MSKIKEIFYLNFSELPVDGIALEIEKQFEIPIKESRIKVSMNLGGNCYQQIVDLLGGIHDDLLTYEFIMIIPPSLSIAAVYLVNEICAISGSLPFIIELEKVSKGHSILDGSSYKLKRIRSLEKEKMFTKNKLHGK